MELSIDTEQFVLGNSSTAFSKVFLEIFSRKIPQKSCRNLLGKIPLELFGRGSRDSARKKVEKSFGKIWSVRKKFVSLHYQKRKKQHTNKITTH